MPAPCFLSVPPNVNGARKVAVWPSATPMQPIQSTNTPRVGSAPSHWQDYVQGCLTGRETASSFAWTARLTEWGLLGNAATLRPGERMEWKAEEGKIA